MCILSCMNPVHSLESCFFRPTLISSTHLCLVLPNCFFTCLFFNQDSERTSLLSHACTMPCPSHLPWADEEDLSTLEISDYYTNCTSDPSTWKICVTGIFESRELWSNHYGQHFLTEVPKIYPLVQKLFGHTYRTIHKLYSHNTYIYIHVDLHIQVGEASCNYCWQQ